MSKTHTNTISVFNAFYMDSITHIVVTTDTSQQRPELAYPHSQKRIICGSLRCITNYTVKIEKAAVFEICL